MNLIQHFVNGKIISGKSDRKGKIFNPAIGEQESEVKLGSKLDLDEAVEIIKVTAKSKFEESVEIAINLSLSSGKTDQSVRGIINLPNGIGKKIRIAVVGCGRISRNHFYSILQLKSSIELISICEVEPYFFSKNV
jgi:hypothetical protein